MFGDRCLFLFLACVAPDLNRSRPDIGDACLQIISNKRMENMDSCVCFRMKMIIGCIICLPMFLLSVEVIHVDNFKC